MEGKAEHLDLQTVQRSSYDPEIPYTAISNALIRDNRLSIECRWLITYLLTHTNNWRITVAQIINHCKGNIGRDRVYLLINEAIKHGYMKRETIFHPTLRNQMRYFVSESGNFNSANQKDLKSRVTEFHDPEHQDTENQDPENQGSQELTSCKNKHKKEDKTSLMVSCFDEKEEEVASSLLAKARDMDCVDEKPKRSRKPAEFTTQVKKLTAEMVATILKHEPEYKPPSNLAAFMTEVDYMLRLDKRDSEKVLEVLNWALADHFWRDKMFKPNSAKYLREKYLQLKNQMEAPAPKKDRKFAPCSDDKQAYQTLKEMDKRAL